ncbi:MAG: DUF423 domain-containing protein [Bacteroidota bacterium]
MLSRLSILALLGAAAVVIGAFGAHGLERVATDENIEIYRTGNRYHFYHLFLLFLAIWAQGRKGAISSWLSWSFRLTLVGILLFSGSLYLLGLRDAISANINWLGAITPLGGTFFIMGWVALAIGVRRMS